MCVRADYSRTATDPTLVEFDAAGDAGAAPAVGSRGLCACVCVCARARACVRACVRECVTIQLCHTYTYADRKSERLSKSWPEPHSGLTEAQVAVVVNVEEEAKGGEKQERDEERQNIPAKHCSGTCF